MEEADNWVLQSTLDDTNQSLAVVIDQAITLRIDSHADIRHLVLLHNKRVERLVQQRDDALSKAAGLEIAVRSAQAAFYVSDDDYPNPHEITWKSIGESFGHGVLWIFIFGLLFIVYTVMTAKPSAPVVSAEYRAPQRIHHK